ncbi:MAG: peptidase S9, partial [Calditrichota bacterium]
MKPLRILLIFMVIMLCVFGPQMQAQYYSQNKVQYKDFEFRKLTTEHFDNYYYPIEKEGARVAARMAEKWYGRYVTLFNHELSSRQPLILYASHSDFEQTNIIQGQIGEGTGGVTEGLLRRIVLPFGGPLAETDHVIGHELVHAFQYDMGSDTSGGLFSRGPAAAYLPLWLIEGMAEYFSIGPLDANTAMWMWDAAQSKRLPKYKQLDRPEYFPYRYGQALLAYIGGTYGDAAVPQLLESALGSRDVDMAIRRVTGISPDTLILDWQAAIHDLYDPVETRTKGVDQYGKQLTGQSRQGTELNIAPALSPDGTLMLYFSERNLFFIDMFLANAKTGKVQNAIVSRERNPHLESLEFINSAGAWDAAGRRIAYGAIEQGRPVLYARNVETRKIEHRVLLPSLGEILNPTWAPDGSAIAFSAMTGGYTDLFIYHLDTDQLEQVTNDLYAELQPAWAPDGRSIALVTDRFTTDLSILSTGDYQLALYDLQSKDFTRLQAFQHGKHINPQWSSDGHSLYFLSDVDGITNIYRLDTTNGKLVKITNLYTGVSGITAISPALSVAS